MEEYDPLAAPHPQEWLALNEGERIELVEDYHRRARVHLPNQQVHATVHAVIENQAAMGDATPVRRTLERLMSEGLDRHDAIHAVGMVLTESFHDVMTGAANHAADPNVKYFAAVERLTAEAWQRSGEALPEPEMDITQILDGLAERDGMPVEAIRAARAQRSVTVPVFLDVIRRYLAGESEPQQEGALFLIFHLLGEWAGKVGVSTSGQPAASTRAG